jgi:hypothetical protein
VKSFGGLEACNFVIAGIAVLKPLLSVSISTDCILLLLAGCSDKIACQGKSLTGKKQTYQTFERKIENSM